MSVKIHFRRKTKVSYKYTCESKMISMRLENLRKRNEMIC